MSATSEMWVEAAGAGLREWPNQGAEALRVRPRTPD